MDKSTRGAAGITSLQAGEDVNIAGWRLLRIPAGDIRRDLKACCAPIALALDSPPRSIPWLVP